MKKVLIVEDEESMRLGLGDNLKFDGYNVDFAEDGEKGLNKIRENKYNLILLDIMLPKISGFEVCKTIRKEGVKTPVIMLTAKGEEIDKVLGLEIGADDYITKPFSLRELLARINAVLRRVENDSEEQIKIGKLEVDFNSYTATKNGNNVSLSSKEFDILHYLWNKKNKNVSRDELLSNIWGNDVYTTSRTIDNFILKLRQKIEDNPNDPKKIITIHGIGYKLLT
ncbi:MAG: response regulator transcription factor [Ignavibacteriae bacterium]|nr:response regulator transcription factor [Ignavibacteriota bacterium]MCB9209476.1 response regulator transcription factor [Ignavibacteriales bacterium]MCB9258119.1 response regulator transcription factor [Ignavibacteriales bacterium]